MIWFKLLDRDYSRQTTEHGDAAMTTTDFDFSKRNSENNSDSLFVQRWSPRAFEKTTIDDPTLERILNAARWSPSCFNAQPWRIYTSTEDTFADYLDLLVEGNQAWAKDTALLGFMVAKLNFEHNGKPNDWAEFDCGAAWMSLSLQARLEGLYSHGMGGFKADEATQYLQLADDEKLVMAFSLGKVLEPSKMDEDTRQNEVPNERKSLDEIWLTK